MRLTKEVTEDLVKEVAGEDTIKLVGLLKDKDNISEFKLAEKLRLTVNTVRNMLYRLQAHNLVTSIRKKDKKKGWYIYYWTFNTPQARSLIRVVKQKKLEQLKERLKNETQETFYICPEQCTRFKMVHAMDYDFKCPECGNVLQEEDNTEFINKLKTTIAELEENLAKPILEVRKRSKRIAKQGGRGRPMLVKRGRPKLVRRGRPRLVKRGRPKLARRGRPKLKKRGRPRLTKIKKLKLRKITKKIKRGRFRLAKRGRPRLVKKQKLRKTAKKIRKVRKIKRDVQTIKKRSKPKQKKKTVFKKIKRFLKRKR